VRRSPKKISKKNPFKMCDFPHFFYQLWLILVYKFGIKIPGFHQNIAKNYKTKKMFCFHAYGQVSQRLKKKSYHIFIQQNFNFFIF